MPGSRSPSLRPSLLFSAPHEFLGDVLDGLGRRYDVVAREAWFADELPDAPEAEVWVVNPGQHFVVDDAVLDRFPRLRVVGTPSTGTNHIDRAACAARGIAVRGLLDDREALDAISASAEFTFLLLLNTLRRLDVGLEEVRAGRWRRREERLRGRELQGKRVGLVGYGRIGRRLARYGAAFDASVAYFDPYVEQEGGAERLGSLDEVFAGSDAVVVCCLLTEETRGLVDGRLVRLLPHDAALVNTSRGEVLDEPSVADALEERRDVSFAADVVTGEVRGSHGESPLTELFRRGRIVLTPHMAGATLESQRKAAVAVLGLVEAAASEAP